jgi:hypothetical protein
MEVKARAKRPDPTPAFCGGFHGIAVGCHVDDPPFLYDDTSLLEFVYSTPAVPLLQARIA